MLQRFTGCESQRAWVPTVSDEIVRRFIKHECRAFVQDLWNSLDCGWLPAAPSVLSRANFKGTQLKLARSLGFELPPTLITNSETDLLEFYNLYNGNIVSKLASATFTEVLGNTFVRYTELVTRQDISCASAINNCPMIFQAYVPKQLELRITVVGNRVFPAAIDSQMSNHTRNDWRRYDDFHTQYISCELPTDIEHRCVEIVEQLGLRYGAIDLVLTPDGRYVFLEINPNGQYLWIEEATGLPISEAICDVLIADSSISSPGSMASHLTIEGVG